MEKTLAELIREYKSGNEKSFEKISEKMNPLLMFYADKLYTWEQEDARQEMLVTLFCALEKMKYCKSEGECLSYIKTAVRRRYKDLVLKELHNKKETVHMEWTEVQDAGDGFGEAEFYMDNPFPLSFLWKSPSRSFRRSHPENVPAYPARPGNRPPFPWL